MKVGDNVKVISGDLKGCKGVITYNFSEDPHPCVLLRLYDYPTSDLWFELNELEVIENENS